MPESNKEPASVIRKIYINWAAAKFIEMAGKYGELAVQANQAAMGGDEGKAEELDKKAQQALDEANNVIEFMADLGGQKAVDDVNMEIMLRIQGIKIRPKK